MFSLFGKAVRSPRRHSCLWCPPAEWPISSRLCCSLCLPLRVGDPAFRSFPQHVADALSEDMKDRKANEVHGILLQIKELLASRVGNAAFNGTAQLQSSLLCPLRLHGTCAFAWTVTVLQPVPAFVRQSSLTISDLCEKLMPAVSQHLWLLACSCPPLSIPFFDILTTMLASRTEGGYTSLTMCISASHEAQLCLLCGPVSLSYVARCSSSHILPSPRASVSTASHCPLSYSEKLWPPRVLIRSCRSTQMHQVVDEDHLIRDAGPL